jgi:hypothetical protein
MAVCVVEEIWGEKNFYTIGELIQNFVDPVCVCVCACVLARACAHV